MSLEEAQKGMPWKPWEIGILAENIKLAGSGLLRLRQGNPNTKVMTDL